MEQGCVGDVPRTWSPPVLHSCRSLVHPYRQAFWTVWKPAQAWNCSLQAGCMCWLDLMAVTFKWQTWLGGAGCPWKASSFPWEMQVLGGRDEPASPQTTAWSVACHWTGAICLGVTSQNRHRDAGKHKEPWLNRAHCLGFPQQSRVQNVGVLGRWKLCDLHWPKAPIPL